MTFNTRLFELRVASDMRQYELALKLGLKSSAISKYEKGLTQPGISTLVMLADIFEVSVDYLVGISSVKNPYTNDKFTPREAEIIMKYRRLNMENRIRLDERMNAMLETQSAKSAG